MNDRLKKKYHFTCTGKIIYLFLTILALFFIFIWVNKKKVDLKFVAKGRISYPAPPYYDRPFFYLQASGSDLEKTICRRINWLKFNEIDGERLCRVVWEKDFSLNSKLNYYIGIGCSIEEIPYDYFSKYFISQNNSSQEVIYYSGKKPPLLLPEKDERSIIIYEGDVVLTP
ncbi:MAG: hypothetical protein QTN59_00210 [Candidatus Electrothrix communis]|nr:MAG: hypothetical protein QTN59_00210 [Candidatus Electrothrix communis]